ncbi:MAG TPA: SDR family oxidoreductase [Pirellulales bacterium]|jgi:UDP-glucose 4-epimerase|nr:SDR family oxidoreductase [Pirellulales bacterium]
MAKVLVTGGAGFIGSHLVDALVARGDRVAVLDNMSTGRAENLSAVRERIELVKSDLTDREAVRAAVQGVDCVFHQAALASVQRSVEKPLDTHAACVTGTLILIDEARRAKVRRIVYAASSSAYGDQPTASKRETDLPLPISPYGAAKLAAEYYLAAFAAMGDIETVALRYFNVFGPRQDPHSEYSAVIPRFITAMLSGKQPTVYGDGQQSRDFTFVENVVAANLLAGSAAGASGRVLNVAAGGKISLLELIAALNKLLKMNVAPRHEEARIGDVRESMADITLARKLLGYEPRIGFEEGLRRSIDYYVGLVKK